MEKYLQIMNIRKVFIKLLGDNNCSSRFCSSDLFIRYKPKIVTVIVINFVKYTINLNREYLSYFDVFYGPLRPNEFTKTINLNIY